MMMTNQEEVAVSWSTCFLEIQQDWPVVVEETEDGVDAEITAVARS